MRYLKASIFKAMIFKTLALVAIGAAASAAFTPAQAEDCRIIGNASSWGSNMTGAFEVGSGKSCRLGFSIAGSINNSKIARAPQHGTLTQLDLGSFEYQAKPGFTGKDTFAIQASGQSPASSGTSVLSLNVTVR